MAKLIGRHPLTQLYRRQVGDNVLNFRQNLYRERLHIVKSLYKKDLLSHYGCVNAIEFSNDGNFLVSGLCFHHIFFFYFVLVIAYMILNTNVGI